MADGWRGFFGDGGMVMVFDGSFDGGSTSVLRGISEGSRAVLPMEGNGTASIRCRKHAHPQREFS